jgi:hypothetical protein
MASSSAEQQPSPEYLAETNDPYLDQRVCIAFIVLDTFFLLVFYVSRHFNTKAVGLPMLVCNTLCYVFCMGSAATGICESFALFSRMGCGLLEDDLRIRRGAELSISKACGEKHRHNARMA